MMEMPLLQSSDCVFHTSTDRDDPAWDAFVAATPGGHHVQTSMWGQVKGVLGWRTARVVVTHDNEIVGGGQLLIRKAKYFGKVGYVPKGPIMRSGDAMLCRKIIAGLHALGQQNRLRYLAIQPPDCGERFPEFLLKMGFRTSWIELAPTATILIDLTRGINDLQANLKRQTRQNIRRSLREGITVREGSLDDLPTFYRLHLATSERQHFVPYPEDYFAAMWRIFKPTGNIALLVADYQGEPVSSLLLVPFRTSVIAKILGWSGKHGDRRPNHALFWGAIKWSLDRGYLCFDMEGIDPTGAHTILEGQPFPEELRDSPDFLKLGFGGQVVLNPMAYDFVYGVVLRSLYRVFFGPRFVDSPITKKLLNSLRQH